MTTTVNYLSIRDSNGFPDGEFVANNSIDEENNTGWVINGVALDNFDRLAENGAVKYGIASPATSATDISRLGGAGAIEANMIEYKTQYTAPVSGLTAKGRWINKAKGYI